MMQQDNAIYIKQIILFILPRSDSAHPVVLIRNFISTLLVAPWQTNGLDNSATVNQNLPHISVDVRRVICL